MRNKKQNIVAQIWNLSGESKTCFSSQWLRENVQSVKSKVLAQNFLWLTFKILIRCASRWRVFLLYFPIFSMFITLTVSSPWEWLLSKPIHKWMSKFTHRLKPGVVFFHLPGTFLTDPPILEVKTWFAHESSPDPLVLNCPYQSKPNLNESFDI